eukprot:c26291_g3_i1 orf=112-282(-)
MYSLQYNRTKQHHVTYGNIKLLSNHVIPGNALGGSLMKSQIQCARTKKKKVILFFK